MSLLRKWEWGAVVVTAAACVATASVVLARIWPKEAGDVASWVQAIGSIAAIVGAFAVVSIGGRSARRDKQAAVLAVSHAAFSAAKNVKNELTKDEAEFALLVNGHSMIIASYVRTLANVPVHDLTSAKAITAFLLMREHFTLLKEHIDIFVAGPRKHPDLGPEIEQSDRIYPEPEHAQMRRDQVNSGKTVLKGNVARQLGAIETRYREMATALGDVSELIR